jgi:DNA-directed RNA polymerase II subunit RPB1
MMSNNIKQLRPEVLEVLAQMKKDPTKQTLRNPPYRKIKNIQFGILGQQEIMDISVCKVDKSKISSPLEGTVYDERMGPSDSGGICTSCGENIRICPGHFGHIDLAVPVIHPQFSKLLVTILNCICLSCSRIKACTKMIDMIIGEHKDRIISYNDRLKNVETFCKKIPFCKHCQEPCPDIYQEEFKIYSIYPICKEEKKTDKVYLDTEELIIILKKITNEDLQLMGLNVQYRNCSKHNGAIPEILPSFRPEWIILTRIPVLPPVSRPPNYDNMQKSDDDLTSSYTEIIKCNQKLLEGNLNEKSRQDIIHSLQVFISCFIDNKDEKHKHQSGKSIKSIKDRIGRKHGHIRSKLMGKRVDCSARSVITADTTLWLDELGVPERIAESQSFPEIVCSRNIDRLNELLQQGKINMIKQGDKLFINKYSNESNKQNKLRYGDIAYRQLQDGDIVIFNRQPTLHRGGMMAHRVKILPGDTFRLNLAVTSSYNADFDGDEMQMHVVQDFGTVAEIKELMSITKMIVSSQSNQPIIGIIQDCLIASYLMTKQENPIAKTQFMNCVYACGTKYVKKLPDTFKRALNFYSKDLLYIGKVLFSVLLPRDFYYTNYGVRIEQGILIEGIVDKKLIGRSHNSIVHRLYKDYSPEIAEEFLSTVQFMMNQFLIYHGFSVGISDFVINEKNKNGVKESIQKAFIEVSTIQQSNDSNEIKEMKINAALNNRGQNLAVNGLCPNNRLEVMIKSGSKGNKMNIIQIAGHLGQTNVEGQRIPKELDDKSRTLFCFKRGDEHPKSRGFIEHSFMEGLTAEEFFFHCKAGREGVINTAVKTRDSGYTERKLVKRMEDLIVENDLTVRNCVGNIVQFAYGDDNFDATWVYSNGSDNANFVDVKTLASRLNTSVTKKPKKKELRNLFC